MSNSGGIITSPIGLKSDLRPVLKINSYSLTEACTTDNINIWSKYKPVRSSSTSKLTDAQFKELSYGMVCTISGGYGNWSYNKPRGLAYNERYRMQDFNRYNHNQTTGLAFEQDSYTIDILKSTADLTVGLSTDSNKLTVLDFLTTIFNSCTIRLDTSSYDNTTEYTYSTAYKAISAANVKWVIPYSVLKEYSVGRVSLRAQIKKSDGTLFYPLVKPFVLLTITADIGVSVQYLSSQTMISTTNMASKPIYMFSPGTTGASGILQMSGNTNFYFDKLDFTNNSGFIINQTNIRVQMSYRDKDNNPQVKTAPLYNGDNLTNWSAATGTSISYKFGIKYTDFPVISSDGTERNVAMVIQAGKNINGTNTWVNISNKIQLRTIKSS